MSTGRAIIWEVLRTLPGTISRGKTTEKQKKDFTLVLNGHDTSGRIKVSCRYKKIST
jgi:hypothetical protein